jgi:hypothetical protein
MTGRICGAAALVGRRGVLGVKVLACATAKLRKAGRNEWSNGSVSVYCNRSECIGILIGLAVMDEFVVVVSSSWPASVVPVPVHPASRFEILMTTTQ